MTRSSRHKSHRGHKSRDRSGSEDEGSGRGRKTRDDGAGSRVSREADGFDSNGGEVSRETEKKRKERTFEATAVVADRWNGDADAANADGKELKSEDFRRTGGDGAQKVRPLALDSKSKPGGRHDSFGDGKEERGVVEDPKKRRLEKEFSRVENVCKYTDVNERVEDRSSNVDREQATAAGMGLVLEMERGRGSEKDGEWKSERNSREYDRDRRSKRDKEQLVEIGRDRDRANFFDDRQERPTETSNKNPRSSKFEDEDSINVDIENTDLNVHDGLHKIKLEKEQEKRVGSDEVGNKNSRMSNSKSTDDRKSYNLDEPGRSVGYKDEKYHRVKLKEKCQEDLNRNNISRDDRLRDNRTSTRFSDDRSDKHFENNNRGKLQENDHGVEHSMNCKDNRGKKRTSDENEDGSDSKFRNAKLLNSVVEKNMLNDQKAKFNEERGRPGSNHLNKINFSPNHHQSRNSSSHKDESRHSLPQLQAESTRRRSLSKERYRTSSASSGDITNASEAAERVIKSHSIDNRSRVKNTASGDLFEDTTNLYLKSGSRASPTRFIEKSMSSARQYASRKAARLDYDADEIRQRRDGREYHTNEERLQDTTVGKQSADERLQPDLPNNGPTRFGSLSRIRSEHSPMSSQGHLPPPPTLMQATDNASILGSFEDNRAHSGDRKSNNRYRRAVDPNVGRGPAHTWKGIPNWPSPVVNGFIPFQHGPPSAGFPPIVQQFPPSVFGVRPFMNLNHTGVPFHMREAHDRFSSQGHQFGWRNQSDESCAPHLQGWDGNNVGFVDDSQMQGRPDWGQSRHLVNNQGWEIVGNTWKGHFGRPNVEVPASHESDFIAHCPMDENQNGESVHQLNREETEPIQLDNVDSINALDTDTEFFSKYGQDKAAAPASLSKVDVTTFCSIYFSKLDISLELTGPELFERCSDVAGTIENTSEEDDTVPKNAQLQDTREDIKWAVRSITQAPHSLFPQISDDIFKRAISLYKRRDLRAKFKPPSSHFEEKHPPEFLEPEKSKPNSICSPAEDNPLADAGDLVNNLEGNGSDRNNFSDLPSDDKDHMSDEIPGGAAFAEGDGKGHLSDKIPSGAAFAEDSCEDLLPDCLNRIHHSPESTH